ncbi:HAD-IA family hydrolase [Cryobacterium sp. M15]|jgi:sugar-phosphatase|uniref:HAD-IA family hydrolase n=1 Tax=Cryobacterium sp. M15 TaxID=2048291 RepID=UPI000CE499E1|nr:HAD-IA family hydrolase [Cryobacterium sp. M15]
MSVHRCAALLFDLDETLVRSSASIDDAWSQFATRNGLSFEKVGPLLPGRRGSEIISAIFPTRSAGWIDIELAQVRSDELASTSSIEAIQGASALIKKLPLDRWAIVTAAPRALMEARLSGAGLPRPEVAICAEDISVGKPSSEGFLLAASLLRVDPSRCIGLEDSTVGLEALASAGMRAIRVTDGNFPAVGRSIASVSDYRGIAITTTATSIELDLP